MIGNREARERETVADSIADAVLGALGEQDRAVRARAVDDAIRHVDPDALVQVVGDQADSRRRNAAMTALQRGGSRSVPALIKALRDPDPEVVMFSASLLGKTRDGSAVVHLVRLLDSEEINIAQAAIESLGQLRSAEAVGPLVGVLDRDPWLRFAAVHALGEIGHAQAISALVGLLSDSSIREGALLALGRIGSVQVIDALATWLLQAEDANTFAVCLRAVGEVLHHQPADARLNESAAWVRLAGPEASAVHLRLLRVLASEDNSVGAVVHDVEVKSAAARLIRALRLQSLYTPMLLAGRNPELADVLLFCAVGIGEEIAPSLSLALAYDNGNVQCLACRCVGALRLEELGGKVEDLATAGEAAVRRVAIETLARMARMSSLPVILHGLDDEDDGVVGQARTALVEMEPESVTEAILADLRAGAGDKVERIARSLEVLAQNPHPAQRAFIDHCIRHVDLEVRRRAALALGAQPEHETIAPLAELLRDPERRVRAAAIQALASKRSRKVRDLLLEQAERDPETRAHSVRALAELRDCAVAPFLIDLFYRESDVGRLAIVEALAALRDPAAEPIVASMLVDEDDEMRRCAAVALANFGTRTALRHLVACAKDPVWQVRAAVAEVLRADEALSVAALERLAMDRNQFVAAIARHRLEDASAS